MDGQLITSAMTTFGWKRKAGAMVVKSAATSFEGDAKDDDNNEVTRGEVDWLTLAPKRHAIQLEDARTKSQRLCMEGATLAEAERYWEAMKKWDEGLLLMPTDSKMLEMKAQALMAVGEAFLAVQVAKQAVQVEPTWWVAWQTLGRAQLNLGEVRLAVRSFSKAVLINPCDQELWTEDLLWACSVRDRMKHSECVQATTTSTKPTLMLLGDDSDSDTEGKEREANLQIVPRTLKSHNGESKNADSDDRKTLRRLPDNYVQLRG